MEVDRFNNDRSIGFNFEKQIAEAFSFLTTNYNLDIVSASPTIVRYESGSIFVNIYHGRTSHELGVEIGLIAKEKSEEKAYVLSELMRLGGEKKANEFMRPIADTPDKIQQGILIMSSLLEQYGHEALSGNSDIFEQLSIKRVHWNTRFANEIHVRQAREKADIAFQKKKFPEVVKAYESMLDDLLPIEQKKLEYARKKCKEKKFINKYKQA
jgi:hypothetical protein